MRLFATGILFFLCFLSLNAQPILRISPEELEYRDVFHRLQNAYFKNIGNQPLVIDSIYYTHNDFYYLRFDRNWRYPLTILPGDSIMMDCILSGYLNYTLEDVLDTLYIYNNGTNPYEFLKIKIDYYEDNFYSGFLQGNVSSGGSPVANADIYFLYGGNFIIARTTSDANGNYSAELPVGNYSVAAVRDSFYTTFYDQQYDPLNAAQVTVDTNGYTTANLTLVRKTPTVNSISGSIFDSMAVYPLKRGIVIVRNGTHTPQKVVPEKLDSPAVNAAYTAFVNDDGTYNIDDIIDPGYYFVQSFSDYFVPTYYDSTGNYPSFWQNADSIYIGSPVTNADIYMPRDSSIGGGVITGTVGITGNRD
ncbi:MAG TPA: carboxypeptidase-like regulatory domain-containing protein, partial [Ignavibacteriaceae bacterium]